LFYISGRRSGLRLVLDKAGEYHVAAVFAYDISKVTAVELILVEAERTGFDLTLYGEGFIEIA
jgi:hypothetical protein